MPPKVKITKEMVLNAAFEITRADGIEAINAKNVAAYLKCSTQPVMYNFATIEELKLAVFDQAFEYMKRKVVFPKGKIMAMTPISMIPSPRWIICESFSLKVMKPLIPLPTVIPIKKRLANPAAFSEE